MLVAALLRQRPHVAQAVKARPARETEGREISPIPRQPSRFAVVGAEGALIQSNG